VSSGKRDSVVVTTTQKKTPQMLQKIHVAPDTTNASSISKKGGSELQRENLETSVLVGGGVLPECTFETNRKKRLVKRFVHREGGCQTRRGNER